MAIKQNRVLSPTDEAYSEWQMAYDHFNQALFGGILPYCLITLQREKHTMGYFSSDRFANRSGQKTDEIAINPSYFAVCGVDEALQTLVHEMCHLWQHHFGSPGRGRYHNKEWADFMENIGLMPSHTGSPGGRKTGDKIADYIVPGGPMEASIVDLKAEGFELQWMDRFVAKPMKEIEVKLRFDSAASARERIVALGASEQKPRQFEDNVVFDRDDLSLKRAGTVLRLRTKGGRNVLTLKTPVEGEHRHKVREETETTVADAEAMARVLHGLGFAPFWRYQKHRTVYNLGNLAICLDETPIGCFVELEGPPDEIDDVAGRLGFSEDSYIRDTYRELQEQDAASRGVTPGDLLVEREPDRTR